MDAGTSRREKSLLPTVGQMAPSCMATGDGSNPPAPRFATDDMSAAMARRLNEPLAALLLYLDEIQQQDGSRPGDLSSHSIKKMVGLALQEVRRVCSIMEKLDRRDGASDDDGVAVARRREGTEALAELGSVDLRNAIRSRVTPREWEALNLITAGSSNKEGGRRMGISTRTFEVHRAHLMQKLGARNAADLVRLSLSTGR